MNKIIFLYITLICMAPLSLSANPFENSQREQQRELFVQANKAREKGNSQQYQQLKQQLKNYPLYPYLIHDDLIARMDSLPNEEIIQFLQDYPDSAASADLRKKWLNQLAKKESWNLLTQHYKPTKDPILNCLTMQGNLMMGNYSAAIEMAPQMWMVKHSQVEECDPVFNTLINNGSIDEEMIWQRYMLALQKNNIALAKYLKKLLPEALQTKAQLAFDAHEKPQQAINNKQLRKKPDDHTNIIIHAIKRLAKKNPQTAAKNWQYFSKRMVLSPYQQQQVNEALAIAWLSKDPTGANHWINSLDKDQVTEKLYSIQIRRALAAKDWPSANKWLGRLPKKMQHKPIWLYWKARALEQQGMTTQANDIYKHLAHGRDFYGLLSAGKLNQPYAIKNNAFRLDDDEFAVLAAKPGFVRAYELHQLNRPEEGDSEWWHEVKKLPRSQRYVAAKLAESMDWGNLALGTAVKAGNDDDIGLRYPTMYQNLVLKESNNKQIKPALVYAMIRQESFFKPHAKSWVGARGLMQLMPKTATYIAKKSQYPKPTLSQLYEPDTNIKLGSAYLQFVLNDFNQHPILAIASYNAGPNRIKSWLPKQKMDADIWVENIPFHETREYVKRVITFALIYEYLLGGEPNLEEYMIDVPEKIA